MASRSDLCFFADAPSLADVRIIYGKGTVISWLATQLGNLSEFCGARDKISAPQLYELAGMILADHFFLKLPEIMLFCHRFKSGRYGAFYGAVDPMTILRSLRTFRMERSEAHEKHQREIEEARWRQQMSNPNIMDYDTYFAISQATAEYEMLTREQDLEIENKYKRQ